MMAASRGNLWRSAVNEHLLEEAIAISKNSFLVKADDAFAVGGVVWQARPIKDRLLFETRWGLGNLCDER